MDEPPARTSSCPHCGATQLARGVEVNQTAEAGHIGLAYRVARILRGTEGLRADLCRSCGTVVRLYVRNTDRRWVES